MRMILVTHKYHHEKKLLKSLQPDVENPMLHSRDVLDSAFALESDTKYRTAGGHSLQRDDAVQRLYSRPHSTKPNTPRRDHGGVDHDRPARPTQGAAAAAAAVLEEMIRRDSSVALEHTIAQNQQPRREGG